MSKTYHKPKQNSLYENVWMVNQDEFDSCKITDLKQKYSRLLHICDKPEQLNFYTINFTYLFNFKQENTSNIYLLGELKQHN